MPYMELTPCYLFQASILDRETMELYAKKSHNQKGLMELDSVALCGTKQGNSYCGIEHSALPTLRLQVS